MGIYDYVYELNMASYERDMEKQGGRGNDDKNCDVDIRGEVCFLSIHLCLRKLVGALVVENKFWNIQVLVKTWKEKFNFVYQN